MPSLWSIHVGYLDPREIRPNHLHAAVCHWLDGPAHHAGHKPFAISPPREDPDSGTWFPLALLDHALRPLLRERLAKGRIRLGRHQVERTPQEFAVLQASVRWEDLLRHAESKDIWDVHFESPVTFLEENLYQPLPLARSVFRRPLESWRAYSASPAPQVYLATAPLTVESLDVRTVSFPLGLGNAAREVVGFLGRVTYRVHTDQRDLSQSN